VISQQIAPAGRFARIGRDHRAEPTGHVLVVSADNLVRSLIGHALERDDLAATAAATGQEALRTLFHEQPDIVIVDLELPGGAGWELLGRIRDLCDAPVIVLGARGDEQELVKALRAGADVHLARPLSTIELLAYSAALLRRAGPRDDGRRTFYADGLVELDLRQAEARVGGELLQLTPLEMRLLTELMEHPNQTLSAAQLLDRVWGPGVTERERVKIYIGYLRAKFKAAGTEAPIVTVRGFGYRYVVDGA
jgi:DNA-binding response OmpR family regulator